ncbi:regulatory protein [Anaerotaenia torta]|uniref:regulatory protein RecX n=1 Tax=Anaerotaenia torta TaxID=433293 RepID=UPI003D2060C6
MRITQITEERKHGFKVFLDEEYAFLLYEKEIEKYNLKEGISITAEQYEELQNEVIYPRGLQKALNLLRFMDRCEQELRGKLAQEAYPEEIIDRVMDYMRHYDYLSDERFAAGFIRSRKMRKSKLMIKTELLQKGVSQELVDQALQAEYEEEPEDAERIAIQKAIAKKTGDPAALSYEEKQKLMASLYRKGFDMGKVRDVID